MEVQVAHKNSQDTRIESIFERERLNFWCFRNEHKVDKNKAGHREEADNPVDWGNEQNYD